MNEDRYQVVKYSKDRLVAFFVEGGHASRATQISSKPQVEYLHHYCTDLQIKTLVREFIYIDKYFSDDYSGYYSKSFPRYRRFCQRIHFFSEAISPEDFDNYFRGGPSPGKGSWSDTLGYHGFVVIKPLPHTVIGRTCLRPIGSSGQSAVFPPLITCTANLFGIGLEIASIPFQEQDREVAACATSALWSALYATARAYQHAILSPLQITRIAISTFPILSRSLPNDGLTIDHMVGVIRHLGLELDLIDLSDIEVPAQAYIYAYLRGGIPLVLGFDFNPLDGSGEHSEAHAVTLTGYSTVHSNITPLQTGFLLRATRLKRFYAHDDGVGPFAPMTMIEEDPKKITTAWREGDRRIEAHLDQLLIPLYPQIRTPFGPILAAIMELDGIIHTLCRRQLVPLSKRLEWDIYMVQLDNLRREILTDSQIPGESKIDVVTESLPRFLWRATAYHDGDPKIDLLFDATDLRQGKQYHRFISYDSRLDRQLAANFAAISEKNLKSDLTYNILEGFRSYFTTRNAQAPDAD